MSILDRIDAAAGKGGPVGWEELAKILIEAALIHPTAIDGHRDSDWGKVLIAVIACCAPHARLNIFQSLLLLPKIPAVLVRDLVNAAGPEVLESVAMDEDILVSLTRSASQEELLCIASRPDLSNRIVDCLVARGNARVHRRLAANHACPLGPACLSTLTELAYFDRELKENLIARPDLPPAHLERLWPFLSADAKQRAIMAAPGEIAERLAKLLGDNKSTSRAKGEADKPAAPRKWTLRQVA